MPVNIKKYFRSTSTERKGMYVLVLLLMFVISYYWIEDYIYDPTPIKVELKEIKEAHNLNQKLTSYNKGLKESKSVLFQFNPNTISKEKWMQLGFSTKQAQSIINFRKSGFKFKSKEDMKKLFVVDDEKYQQLAPFVLIPKEKLEKEKQCYRILYLSNTEPVYDGLENLGQVYYKNDDGRYKYYSASFESLEKANVKLLGVENAGFEGAFITKLPCGFSCYPIRIKEKKPFEKKKIVYKRVTVALNKADTTELKTLKGIGSYYAKKIVAYRNQLGGFYESKQLLEVYGIKPEVLEENLGFISVDTTLVTKININTVSKEELKKHPYIKWNVANSIVLYRANHGKYKSVQKIQNSDLVNDELYRKIVRYLMVE